MTGNSPFRETPFLAEVTETLRTVLPPTWHTSSRSNVDAKSDGVLTIHPPNGPEITFVIEAKRGASSSSRAVAALRDRQRQAGWPLLYLSDYINPTLRRELAESGISYTDLTGWRRIALDAPPLFILTEGAPRAPRDRDSTSIARLSGRAAGRVIRRLLEGSLPTGVRELAQASKTSPGTVAKILPTLQAEGAVERDESGSVITVHKRQLLARWTSDYGYLKSNGITLDYVAPRGIPNLMSALEGRIDVALTGSAAARYYLPPGVTPVAAMSRLTLYARDVTGFADQMRLARTERAQGNVIITVPKDSQLIDNAAEDADGRLVVPVSQVLADLLTLPGRYEQEAEQLMDVLARRDKGWRADQ